MKRISRIALLTVAAGSAAMSVSCTTTADVASVSTSSSGVIRGDSLYSGSSYQMQEMHSQMTNQLMPQWTTGHMGSANMARMNSAMAGLRR